MKKFLLLLSLSTALWSAAEELPFTEFPGVKGEVTFDLTLTDKSAANQNIVRVYSLKSDGLTLCYRKNRLTAAFYDRSAKKWYNTSKTRPLPENAVQKVSLSWAFPGKLSVSVNGKPAGEVSVPVEAEFASDSRLFIGTNQLGAEPLAGKIANVKFSGGSVGNLYGEITEAKFAADGDAIILPAAVFPGAAGAVSGQVCMDSVPASVVTVMSVYSPRGDVMNLLCRKDRLSVAFFDRSNKKWQRLNAALPLAPGKAAAVLMQWQIPGEISLTVNGKTTRMAVTCEAGFAPDSSVSVGGSYQKKNIFPGAVKNFRFSGIAK